MAREPELHICMVCALAVILADVLAEKEAYRWGFLHALAHILLAEGWPQEVSGVV